MPENALPIVRTVILAVVVLSVLQATVLFQATQRWMLRLSRSQRAGGTSPSLMRDERIQRGWSLLMAALLFALWWYLGTPTGAEWFRNSLQ